MEYRYHKLTCKCGRKILVDSIQCGVDHTISIAATCAECLNLSEEFKNEHSEAAKDIEEWLFQPTPIPLDGNLHPVSRNSTIDGNISQQDDLPGQMKMW